MTALIKVQGLSKCYNGKPVLQDVDLTVNAGQILGLVGPNGSGKTTCMQALLGLINYQGDIDILGYQPNKQRVAMLRDVAYIADVSVLPKWLTVSQALSYMAASHVNFNRGKAEIFLAKTNISNRAKVASLSKGMVTQLHLALVMAIDAKVLILDEPTLGLDVLTRRQFYQHLLEDFYDEHKCIIITTHQIDELEHVLTDVAFIKNGKIILSESIDAINKRFKLVAVGNENKHQAETLNPIFANSLMGMTTMLFDQSNVRELEALGKVTTASLSDVFVGLMTQEVTQ
ncbi:ABC transporter ATP-binding protein [Paraglaciecola hydrolytica]|uniref:Multidrug ABC transporter ATP-binding protein n=1 Tax=Paraglaciecola hydrolytica TaxID=1799789 RepID=A0A148KNF4_9ALTE|nr:ABC transporter ATP-binding protein [Paraglaciecola hydrolytica]KXI27853.1 multidrug ABC transporter ATP-binding protein [Paraglaciecola hydrolytica]